MQNSIPQMHLMMRRIFLLLIFVGLAATARAQDSELPSQKYSVATGSFWSNWFLQADIAASSFYGDRTNAPGMHLSSSLLKGYRTNMDLSVALGKWFTPGLGLRTKFSGPWGRTVVSDDRSTNASRCWTLDGQALFNLSNMFRGYSETRRWSLIPYASAGIGRNMTHDTYAFGLGLGLLNEFRLSSKAAVHIDLSWRAFEPDFDGAGGHSFGRGLHSKDQIVALSVGLTWNIGSGTFSRIKDDDALNTLVESQMEALNAQLMDQQMENQRLRKLIEQMEQKK